MDVAQSFGYDTKTNRTGHTQHNMGQVPPQVKNHWEKPSSVSPPTSSQGQTSQGPTPTPLPAVDKRAADSTTRPEAMGTRTSMGNAIPAAPRAGNAYVAHVAQDQKGGPWDLFKKNLVQKWRAPLAYPPRGSIRLTGLVEVSTSRGSLMVDCVAWWDPQMRKFDRRTLSLKLRATRPNEQGPLR